jgi:hypothetical protein
MSDGGKGSSPRPFSIANDEYSKRWDAIFSRDLKEEEDQKIEDEAFNDIIRKKEYYDILSTEDCLIESETDKNERNDIETQEVKK